MWVNLYDTAMVNFQKYKLLGILGVITNVFISIPITLVFAFAFKSLMSVQLSTIASNILGYTFFLLSCLFDFC